MFSKRKADGIKLYGEYYVKLDEGFRLLLPRLFVEFTGNDQIVIISVDCLECLTPISLQGLVFIRSRDLDDWKREELPKYEADCKTKKAATIYAKARLDKRGRTTIPTQFRHKITRQAALVGVMDHFELWPRQAWEEYLRMAAAEYRVPDSLHEYGF
jgi:DNA-binding transcriptional regulator/RsmH inhibitor MraZ